MQALNVQAMYRVCQALLDNPTDAARVSAANTACSYSQAGGAWMRTAAFKSSNYGTYYNRNSPTCYVDGALPIKCDSSEGLPDDGGMRINTVEGIGGWGYEYKLNPSSSLKSQIDDLYGNLFLDGGPNHIGELDRYWMYDPSQLNKRNKWFGMFFGIMRSWSWLSLRLGGVQDPTQFQRTLSVGFKLSNISGATQVKITLTKPDGTEMDPVSCSSSPCSIPNVDGRLGDHLMRLEYWNGGSRLAVGADVPIHVQ